MAQTQTGRHPKGYRPERPRVRRISISIPEVLYQDLVSWADEREDSMSGVFRWSFGIAKVVWDQLQDGNRICVKGEDGIERELIFNRYV